MFIKSLNYHDHYNTPKEAWEWLIPYIPKDKIIWEPFFSDGKSGKILKELGLNVIHENIDFFDNNLGDIIISNPPFTATNEIIKRLIEIDKPFILLMSAYKLHTRAFKDNFKNNKLQLLIPPKRIQYIKMDENMNVIENQKNRCSFESIFYCYKMDFKNDIIFM